MKNKNGGRWVLWKNKGEDVESYESIETEDIESYEK